MGRLLKWLVGLFSLAALVRLLMRRRQSTTPMPPPWQPSTPTAHEAPSAREEEASVGERRIDVHERAKVAIEAMRKSPSDASRRDDV